MEHVSCRKEKALRHEPKGNSAWLSVLNKLRTLAELDAETIEALFLTEG